MSRLGLVFPHRSEPSSVSGADKDRLELNMKYLIRKTGRKQKAHIWFEGPLEGASDTACRMWSTGGLRQDRYEVRTDRGEREICHMCQHLTQTSDSQ